MNPKIPTHIVLDSSVIAKWFFPSEEDSDIDFLIEFPKGKSLLDLVRLERKLAETLGKKVDIITYKSVSPLLQKYIQQDQIQIL